ncbi:MAG TPA: type II toxin-antitoxin system VapC family toxin [Solirubrobacteraceae bacterium]|nr:type II toxin-antitoxin system VapC family toxin [Solirubrobacteraceae bacterium]
MRLPDTNLLLYAADEDAELHDAALQWMEEALSGTETVAFAWVALLGFVRIGTNPALYDIPMRVERALEVVDGWLAQPCVTIVHPTDRHAAVLRDLLTRVGAAGNLTTDAHLAALALEHGATLYSSDNDFSRFPGLRWVNPLNP